MLSPMSRRDGALEERHLRIKAAQLEVVSRELGDPVILGLALVTLGDELVRPGDLDRAIAALEEGVAILRAEGDRAAVSRAAISM